MVENKSRMKEQGKSCNWSCSAGDVFIFGVEVGGFLVNWLPPEVSLGEGARADVFMGSVGS